MEMQAKITAKQVAEILRGKQPKKNWLRSDFIEQYKGKLKTMKESDIKRLIVQLLIMRVLKERFEMQSVRGTQVKNVFVFLQIS
jgi:superfamily II DNA helicase RecQ